MELQRGQELIKGFGKHKVLVVGDVVLDQYVHGEVERLNPEAPVPVLRATHEEERSGAAGNVAKNVAMLGAESVLVSVVGDDKMASRVEQIALTEGYQVKLVRDDSRPTIRKIRHVVNGQQMLRVDYEETHDIDKNLEQKLIEVIRSEIDKGVDAIIVSDYAKGTITRAVAEAILDMAGQKDILVAADVKPSRASFFLGATLVTPNILEAHGYVGVNYHEKRLNPAELAKMVYSKICSDVYLTMGKDGMYVYCGGQEGKHVPQEHVVEVADPSGAGDTSVVVLLLGLLSGASEEEASMIANSAGAAVVSKIGSVGITAAELTDMLHRHPRYEKSRIA